MDTETTFWLVLATLIGLAAVLVAYRAGVTSSRTRVAQLEGRCNALHDQLSTRATLDETLQPLQSAMSSLTQQVETAERARITAISGLSEQVLGVGRDVGAATKDVRMQAQRITEALSRTQNQGTWGEMQLRRLVEASGMLNHVHFVEQSTVSDEDRSLRPDMLIDLGEGREVVVDAKVSLDAFLDPELDDDTQARRHAAAVSENVARLSSKQYWKATGTPEFVIMFLPAEHMLGVALRAQPGLLQDAFDRKIVLATPTTLMATLRSISWAWQQAAMADQARDVLVAGRQVHDRLVTMGGYIAKLGKSLGDAVGGYNQFIGSLDARVMPAARRLSQIVAVDEPAEALSEVDVRPRKPQGVDETVRPLPDTG
ncbi:MAG: DNA recombination protein RmuC [Candidatus Nanopelagicales bacterium]